MLVCMPTVQTVPAQGLSCTRWELGAEQQHMRMSSKAQVTLSCLISSCNQTALWVAQEGRSFIRCQEKVRANVQNKKTAIATNCEKLCSVRVVSKDVVLPCAVEWQCGVDAMGWRPEPSPRLSLAGARPLLTAPPRSLLLRELRTKKGLGAGGYGGTCFGINTEKQRRRMLRDCSSSAVGMTCVTSVWPSARISANRGPSTVVLPWPMIICCTRLCEAALSGARGSMGRAAREGHVPERCRKASHRPVTPSQLHATPDTSSHAVRYGLEEYETRTIPEQRMCTMGLVLRIIGARSLGSEGFVPKLPDFDGFHWEPFLLNGLRDFW